MTKVAANKVTKAAGKKATKAAVKDVTKAAANKVTKAAARKATKAAAQKATKAAAKKKVSKAAVEKVKKVIKAAAKRVIKAPTKEAGGCSTKLSASQAEIGQMTPVFAAAALAALPDAACSNVLDCAPVKKAYSILTIMLNKWKLKGGDILLQIKSAKSSCLQAMSAEPRKLLEAIIKSRLEASLKEATTQIQSTTCNQAADVLTAMRPEIRKMLWPKIQPKKICCVVAEMHSTQKDAILKSMPKSIASKVVVCVKALTEMSTRKVREAEKRAAKAAATSTCGDGKITGPEDCDDGNTEDSDGCNKMCKIESGYVCYKDQDLLRTSGTAPSTCQNARDMKKALKERFSSARSMQCAPGRILVVTSAEGTMKCIPSPEITKQVLAKLSPKAPMVLFENTETSGSPLTVPSQFSTKVELIVTCPILGSLLPTAASTVDRPRAQATCHVQTRKSCLQGYQGGEPWSTALKSYGGEPLECAVDVVTTCKEVTSHLPLH